LCLSHNYIKDLGKSLNNWASRGKRRTANGSNWSAPYLNAEVKWPETGRSCLEHYWYQYTKHRCYLWSVCSEPKGQKKTKSTPAICSPCCHLATTQKHWLLYQQTEEQLSFSGPKSTHNNNLYFSWLEHSFSYNFCWNLKIISRWWFVNVIQVIVGSKCFNWGQMGWK